MPFQYEPYRSDLSGTIAELMMRGPAARAAALRAGGAAQARASEINSITTANMVRDLGAIAAGAVNTYAQTKADAPRRELETLQVQEAKRRLSTPSVEAQWGTALRGAYAPNGTLDPQALLSAVPPEKMPEAMKLIQDTQDRLKKFKDDTDARKASELTTLASGVRSLGYTPTAFGAALRAAVDHGVLSKSEGDQIITWAMQAGPKGIQAETDKLLARTGEGQKLLEPKITTLGPDQTAVNMNVPPGTTPPVVAAGRPKVEPPKPVFRVGADKRTIEQVGEIPANAQIVQEPQPPRVNVNVGGSEPPPPPDPASANILSQTGLGINAFRYLTGQASQLPRDAKTRAAAAKEAETWARAHNVDVATMASQYKSYNDVLSANISRLNNTKIMEQELAGTIQNLQGVVKDQDLGKLKFVNVARVWAGQEVNDDLAQQYALHLSQLRNELTAYYGATQGRTGNNLTVEDKRDAESVIKNGIAKGSLDGLLKAVENSTSKMGTVMQSSVDRSQQAIWSLFGVGQNYKAKSSGKIEVKAPNGTVYTFLTQKDADAFKKRAGIQ